MESQEEVGLSSRLIFIIAILMLILGGSTNISIASDNGSSDDLSIDDIYWPMLGGDIFNTHEGTSMERGLQDPYLKWSDPENSTSTGAVGSDMTPNVRFDDVTPRDIRFIVDSNRTNVFIRDGDTGEISWSVDVRDVEERITSTLFTSPSLLDIDSDGELEVAVVISDGSTHQVALFEPNITLSANGYVLDPESSSNDLVWISIFGPLGTSRSSSPVIHDISGDGIEDIIFGAGNRLYAYHGTNGTLIWYREIGSIGEVLSTPAIYPGSGAIERVVVNSLSVNRRAIRTTVINFDGDHLKNVTEDLTPPLLQYPYPGTIVPMPVISDLAGDGTPFIIVPVPAISNYGRLKIYSYSLELQLEIDDIVGVYDGFLAAGDIGGESGDEIFIQSRRSGFPNSLVAYEVFFDGAQFDSRRVWTRESQSPTPSQYSPPLICDLDEDAVPDVIYFNSGLISAILSDGTYYWNLTVQDIAQSGSGLIGDLNHDGFLDLYLNGYLYSQKLIDLKVKEPFITNIYLDNTEPVEGTPVTINCIIENTWETQVDDVVVKFIDILGSGSDPVLIGYDRLSMTATAEASIEWTPYGSGDHTVTVIIDPDGNITETDEGNNQGDNTFEVLSAFPDLVLTGIHFLRGDGLLIEDEHLVENDPSNILVTIENIGQRTSTGGEIRVNVNGDAPTGGDEYTEIGPVERFGFLNVTVPWTPYGVPENQAEESFLVDVWVSLPAGKEELSTDNNHLSNTTTVKNQTPTRSLLVQGIVRDPEGEPEEGVRVTLEIPRTGGTLGPITTASDGEYGFDMNFIDYLDGDDVTIRASKDMMWGENSSSLYSEDIVRDVNINLTDVPTLSIFISPAGELEENVDPGQEVSVNFIIENNGNILGDITVTKEMVGNSSLIAKDVIIDPATFTLGSGESREVSMTYTVPGDERPNTLISALITCTITGNGTYSKQLEYRHTVNGKEIANIQLISQRNISIGPDSSSLVSFELYIYNGGNVPLLYQVSVSSSLEDHVDIDDGTGQLYPDESKSPFVLLSMPNGTDSISGSIYISTSGLGTVGDFEIRVTRSFPDLRVKGVIGSDPADPNLGEEILIFATIDNGGDIEVSGIECSFFEDGNLIGSRIVEQSILPGEEATITGISWTPSGIGEHTITFSVDPDNEILELDESDNEIERTFYFYPDLSVRTFKLDEMDPRGGSQVKARISVENEGNAPLTRGFRITITLDSLSGDQLISDTFDDDLDPSRDPSRNVDLTITIPDRSGNRSLFIKIEPVGDDEEIDVEDNTYSIEIDIEVSGNDGGIMDMLPFIIAAIVILLIVGAGLYIWKYGLPVGPPPGEDEEENLPVENEGIRVESLDDDVDLPVMDVQPPEEGAPVMEMEVMAEDEIVEKEPSIVAEVLEVEEVEVVEVVESSEEEEPMIAEV